MTINQLIENILAKLNEAVRQIFKPLYDYWNQSSHP